MNSSSGNPFIIAELITRSQQENLTAEEQAQLDEWLASNGEHQLLWKEVNDPDIQQQQVRSMAQFNEDAALERFLTGKPEMARSARSHKAKIIWFRYAAVIIGVMAIGTYLWFRQGTEQTVSDNSKQVAVTEIGPGRKGAILTLEDGSQLLLDSLKEGVIAKQTGSTILLLDGKMVYNPERKGSAAGVYNTMSTPKGRQFQFTLPDGSRVWLNAASSIRYPTAFNSGRREVTITGEVYFEVMKNAKAPFMVNVANQAGVEVLGTSFNVSAYENDPRIQATLVEGAVRVSSKGRHFTPVLLKPLDQAVIGKSDNSIRVQQKVNAEGVLSWKNGMLNFEGVPFQEIMRQVERWYDIEVEYENGVPSINFVGKVSRDIPLSGLLIALESTDVRFRVEGRN